MAKPRKTYTNDDWYLDISSKIKNIICNSTGIKSKQTIINDVHEIVWYSKHGMDVLDYLLDIDFFENVLWESFYEDSTVIQVELMVTIIWYDKKFGPGALLSIISSDQERFSTFCERLLSITTDLRVESDFRLHALVFTFFSELMYSHHLLKNATLFWKDLVDIPLTNDSHGFKYLKEDDGEENASSNIAQTLENEDKMISFKRKWLYQICTKLMALSIEQDSLSGSEAFLFYIQQFLSFLVACICDPKFRIPIVGLLHNLQFCTCFCSELFSPIHKLVHILEFYSSDLILNSEQSSSILDKSSRSKFHEIQLFVRSKSRKSDNKVVMEFLNVSSAYEKDINTLRGVLNTLQGCDIVEIANKILNFPNVPKSFCTKDFIINSILRAIYGNTFDKIYDFSIFVLSIEELFPANSLAVDWITDSMKNSTCLKTFTSSVYLSQYDYLFRLLYSCYLELSHFIKTHTMRILDRLTIQVDSNSQLKIKGSSKYFESIRKLSRSTGSGITIQVPKENWSFDLQLHDYVLLLDIKSPNKYSNKKIVSLYGIYSMSIAQVLYISRSTDVTSISLKLESKSDEMPHFNYVIKFPSNSTELLNYRFISDIFKAGNFERSLLPKIIPTSSQLTSIISLSSKKRKHSNENDFTNSAKKIANQDISNSALQRSSAYNSNSVSQCRSECVSSVTDLLLDVLFQKNTFNNTINLWSTLCIDLNTLVDSFISRAEFSKVLILCDSASQIQRIKYPQMKVLKVLTYNFANDRYASMIDKELDYLVLKVRELYSELMPTNKSEITLKFCLEILPSILNGIPTKSSNKPHGDLNSNSELYAASVETNSLSDAKVSRKYESFQLLYEMIYNIKTILTAKALANDPLEAIKIIGLKYSKVVIATVADLIEYDLITGNYDLIVTIGSRIDKLPFTYTIFKNKSVRKVMSIRSGGRQEEPENSNTQHYSFDFINVRPEYLRFAPKNAKLAETTFSGIQYNAGFKFTHQLINVSNNVVEAEYVSLLYFYMISLGYPQTSISIAAGSIHQKLLIEEVMNSRSKDFNLVDITARPPIIELISNFSPNHYVIYSTSGITYLSSRYLFGVTSGIYIFGPAHVQTMEPSSSLALSPKDKFDKSARSKNTKPSFIHVKNIEKFTTIIKSMHINST